MPWFHPHTADEDERYLRQAARRHFYFAQSGHLYLAFTTRCKRLTGLDGRSILAAIIFQYGEVLWIDFLACSVSRPAQFWW
jgi:hypothetical protein